MNPVDIRLGTIEDAALLAELGRRTFYDTFAKDNTPENMSAYLDAAFGVEKQSAELSDPDSRFLIAEMDGVAVGYSKLRISDELPQGLIDGQAVELERIYVAQDWLGKGIGNVLMQSSLDEARRWGYSAVWLGVWERNPRAIAFYRRWGFVEFGSHIFMVGDDPQTDVLMQRRV